MSKLSDWRAQRLLATGKDALLEALALADVEWQTRYDSPELAAVELGLEDLLEDGPEYGADGEPKELDFNHDSGTSWPLVQDWEEA